MGAKEFTYLPDTLCYWRKMIEHFFGPKRQRHDLAIDLGTANTIVVEARAGSIFREPSLCCFENRGGLSSLVAAGVKARSFLGKTPGALKVVRPLHNGVLSEMRAASEFIRFATTGARARLRRRKAVIGVPADATQAERQALITASLDAGLAEPLLVAEPLLAAIGLGLDVDQARGHMVVDCGAGTTEVAVISLGSLCLHKALRGGSEALDKAIVDHFHLRHRFQIGEATAEDLKIRLSEAFGAGNDLEEIGVSGFSMASGIPETIMIRPTELKGLWEKHCMAIAETVREALAETDPELSHDIHEGGIILTGGGAMTGLLAESIARHTGVRTMVAESPLDAVARGLRRFLAGDQPMAAN